MAMRINPECTRCGGSGVVVVEALGVKGTGACGECVLWDRLRSAGGSRWDHVRRWLAEQVVTLDGKPARIGGLACDFAEVWAPPDLAGVPFSWEAVRRVVVDGGGAFRS
jgi:hypothetical protein